MKKENVGDDNILKIVNEMEKKLSTGETNETIENLKKDYPDNVNELEATLLNYMGENDLKILKTEFLDKWKFLAKKLVYTYE